MTGATANWEGTNMLRSKLAAAGLALAGMMATASIA